MLDETVTMVKMVNQDRMVIMVVMIIMVVRVTKVVIVMITRSYAALRPTDLDWIVGPGYSSGGYFLEKNHEKPTCNH